MPTVTSELGTGVEPACTVLQTAALPLGYPSMTKHRRERCIVAGTGFEPVTSGL